MTTNTINQRFFLNPTQHIMIDSIMEKNKLQRKIKLSIPIKMHSKLKEKQKGNHNTNKNTKRG